MVDFPVYEFITIPPHWMSAKHPEGSPLTLSYASSSNDHPYTTIEIPPESLYDGDTPVTCEELGRAHAEEMYLLVVGTSIQDDTLLCDRAQVAFVNRSPRIRRGLTLTYETYTFSKGTRLKSHMSTDGSALLVMALWHFDSNKGYTSARVPNMSVHIGGEKVSNEFFSSLVLTRDVDVLMVGNRVKEGTLWCDRVQVTNII